MKINKQTIDGIYTILTPEKRIPLLLDSPHGGAHITKDFQYSCDKELIRKSIEFYLDELYEDSIQNGATFLKAEFIRSYIDPNRSEYDIDDKLFMHPWPYKSLPTKKSTAGIGLIRRIIAPNTPIYKHKLTHQEAKCRIEHFYKPYHKSLKNNLEQLHKEFGSVYHINCHSMPSSIFTGHGSHLLSRPVTSNQPDFILGNIDGKTCSEDFIHFCKNILKSQGFKVYINKIYKGADIVKKYGNPNKNKHSMQIEINRSIFMNETTLKKSKDFKKIKETLNILTKEISDYIQHKTDLEQQKCAE